MVPDFASKTKRKKTKTHPNTKFLPIFNGRNKKSREEFQPEISFFDLQQLLIYLKYLYTTFIYLAETKTIQLFFLCTEIWDQAKNPPQSFWEEEVDLV